MNKQIEDLMYHAGLTAQGCWDEMDNYDRKAIEKFALLIVQECIDIVSAGISNATDWDSSYWDQACENRAQALKQHFGVEE